MKLVLTILLIIVNLCGQRFAVVGDFGVNSNEAIAVADLINSWNVDFIISTGDNDYSDGSRMCEWKARFNAPVYAVMGNHDDYDSFKDCYKKGRNYVVSKGKIDFYMLDSQYPQRTWFETIVLQSQRPIRIAVFHYPVYSSNFHGSTPSMNWNWHNLPIHAIFNSHDHGYERIEHLGQTFIVNGLGGAQNYCDWVVPYVSGSWSRYCSMHGAVLLNVEGKIVKGQFINIAGQVIDSFEFSGTNPLYFPPVIPDTTTLEVEDDKYWYLSDSTKVKKGSSCSPKRIFGWS